MTDDRAETATPDGRELLQKLAEARRDRERQATLVSAVSKALARPGSKDAVLKSSAEAIAGELAAALVRIWTLDEARGELVQRASAGTFVDTDCAHARIPLAEPGIGGIAASRQSHLTDDVAADPGLIDPAWARRSAAAAFAGYPLISEDKVVGVMAVFAAEPLTPATLETLAVLADVLAVGISGKRAALGKQAAAEELRETAEYLKGVIAQLEQTNAELDRFAYVVSHDLKAPLRGIANLSQWIEEDLGTAVPEPVRGHMDKLRGRVGRLEALIDGILQYSRVGRTKTTPEPVEVKRLVREVIELLAPPPHVALAIAADLPVITTERVLLLQVLMNLIGNAVKYGKDSDAHITVGARDRGEHWEIFVADDGPGIPPEQHERIWGVFQTLKPRDSMESTGIGLAIVKKIVTVKGGRAWVDSAVGRGATFSFTWPKQPDPTTPSRL